MITPLIRAASGGSRDRCWRIRWSPVPLTRCRPAPGRSRVPLRHPIRGRNLLPRSRLVCVACPPRYARSLGGGARYPAPALRQRQGWPRCQQADLSATPSPGDACRRPTGFVVATKSTPSDSEVLCTISIVLTFGVLNRARPAWSDRRNTVRRRATELASSCCGWSSCWQSDGPGSRFPQSPANVPCARSPNAGASCHRLRGRG